jgi:hypothetical protein
MIYDKSKMNQKVVYPTKQTPSYADWALFEMGKELEANGSAYDEANTVILQTIMGIKATFVAEVSVTVDDGVATEITLGESTYLLDYDETKDNYAMYVTAIEDENLAGFLYIYGDIQVDTYIGANVCLVGNRYLYYGNITEVTETPGV